MAPHSRAATCGTTLLATDAMASVLLHMGHCVKPATISYTPYGQCLLSTVEHTRTAFNGEQLILSLEKYLLGNGYRAYSPTLMRFISSDSWSPFRKGGLNAYAYCHCDPVNRNDPTGQAGDFKIPNHGDKTQFRPSQRKPPSSTRMNIPRNLERHDDHLLFNVLDKLPDEALANLSEADPTLERSIASRSLQNLEKFMKSNLFTGLSQVIESPGLGIRRKEASQKLQSQIEQNTKPEVAAYLRTLNLAGMEPARGAAQVRDSI